MRRFKLIQRVISYLFFVLSTGLMVKYAFLGHLNQYTRVLWMINKYIERFASLTRIIYFT
jgi:hypothetical protein